MISAFVSALTNASGLIIDKIILSRERVALKVYLPISFLFLCAFTLIVVPWLGQIDWQLASLSNAMFLVFIMLILAIGSNVLYYQTLQQDKAHHHEMLQMLTPLFTVILAAVFFPEDLNVRVLILALVASGALIYSKSNREHFLPSQTTYNALLAIVMLAAENVVIRELLYFYTPVSLYAIRTAILAVFFYLYYRPKLGKVKSRHWGMIALSSLIGAITMITRYYAFSELGLIFTMMITILAPIMVFIFSWSMLHEHIKARVIVSSVIILSCVILSTLII